MKKLFTRLNKRQKRRFFILSGINFLFLLILLFCAGAIILNAVTIFLIIQFLITVYHLSLRPEGSRTTWGEWFHAIIFAFVAAIIIRSFMLEAFTIPSSSMEKTLLVGDFLFVSKVTYGPRIPMTPVTFPFSHHTLPYHGWKSYLEWLKLPYYRLPGYSHIKNNDVVVFNYPMEDFRPVDKREHYIKRCVAIPGDTLVIKQREVFINSKKLPMKDHALLTYHVKTDDVAFFEDSIRYVDAYQHQLISNMGDYIVPLSKIGLEQLSKMKNVSIVERLSDEDVRHYYSTSIFPYDKFHDWNVDNFGPLVIPKKGVTVTLDSSNIAIYLRIIENYEGNKLSDKGNKILINDKETNTYTFKMDYYFMMGDNRYFSEDSRFWGFVPEDHIVGKAVMVWMSWDADAKGFFSKVRWRRIFSFID